MQGDMSFFVTVSFAFVVSVMQLKCLCGGLLTLRTQPSVFEEATSVFYRIVLFFPHHSI